MPRQYLKRSKPGIIVRRKLRLGCIVTCSGEQNAAYYCIFLRLTYIRVFIQEIGRRVLIASGSGADRNGRNYRIGSETIDHSHNADCAEDGLYSLFLTTRPCPDVICANEDRLFKVPFASRNRSREFSKACRTH